MPTLLRAAIIPICALILTGCTGTMMTRSSSPMEHADPAPHSMFGGYPFQAVVVDFQIEKASGNAGNTYEVFASLAVDLVLDTVLAPIDLVAWAFGCHKRSMVSEPFRNY